MACASVAAGAVAGMLLPSVMVFLLWWGDDVTSLDQQLNRSTHRHRSSHDQSCSLHQQPGQRVDFSLCHATSKAAKRPELDSIQCGRAARTAIAAGSIAPE